MRKNKKKIIQLPVEFNPGTMRYEPKLLLRRLGRKPRIKIDWKFIVILIILVGFMFILFLIILKKYIPTLY